MPSVSSVSLSTAAGVRPDAGRDGGPDRDPGAGPGAGQLARRGVRGACLLYAGLVLVWAFCVPLFGPADERAHVDYAWQVAHGHLPVAGTDFTAEFPQLGQVGYVQHVSNHPPLYYAFAGPVLRIADALGQPAAGLYALRLVNAAMTLLTILVIARIAAVVLARARPRVRTAGVITACVLTAVNPALVAASGAVQNDALAILLGALVALVVARATRAGVDRRTVLQVALLCTLGTLTRVTFISVAAVAVAALVALTLWPDLRLRRPSMTALRTAAGRALAVGAAIAIGAGWFLVLNLDRYGDLTGGAAVYMMESVQERTLAPGAGNGPLLYLLHPHTWWVQFLQLAAPVPSISRDRLPYVSMSVAVIVVLALAVIAFVRRRGAGILDRPGAISLLFLGLVFAGSVAKLAVHVTNRGGANQRYLLDALGFWAVGAAVLLYALGRFLPYAVALLGALGAAGTVSYAAGIVVRQSDSPDPPLTILRDSLADSRVPLAGVVCAAVLLLACTGLAVAFRAARASTEEVRP